MTLRSIGEFVAVLAVAGVALVFWSSVLTPPSKTSQAKRAFATAAPVILALDHHRRAIGTYPVELLDLTPDDIAAAGPDTAASRASLRRLGNDSLGKEYWRYSPDSGRYDRYTLSVGFSRDRCSYESQKGQWDCFGVQ